MVQGQRVFEYTAKELDPINLVYRGGYVDARSYELYLTEKERAQLKLLANRINMSGKSIDILG